MNNKISIARVVTSNNVIKKRKETNSLVNIRGQRWDVLFATIQFVDKSSRIRFNYDIPPFIIEDTMKDFYRRGLKEYTTEKGYLLDTCRASQDSYKKLLQYFEYL